MAKRLHRLSARTVETLTKAGRHADGGNLYLAITKSGAKRWVFLYEYRGKQREAGLGSATSLTLAEARARAAECRSMLARGVDPLEAKKASAAAPTFGAVADELIASKSSGWRSEIHLAQWRSSLDRYCGPIRDKPIDEIDLVAVLEVLKPLWTRIPETGSRVRGRIEAILDFGKVRGWCSGENPAAWKGNLSHLLARRPKVAKAHYAAMPYQDVARFVVTLRERTIAPRLALEFLILTAARSGDVRGATWSEIDEAAKVWTIPASRMKAGVEHRVPLPERAVAILRVMGGSDQNGSDRVFPRLAPMTMNKILPPGVTIHGFRSSFRDWSAEQTHCPREVCEQALAHATGSAVEQAYRRTDLLEKRRGLMEQWARYCEPGAGGNVISLTGEASQ